MTYSDIISEFIPTLLDIEDLDLLVSAMESADFLIYGEIHGIQENAHVMYTLAHRLGIQRIAIEASPSVKEFIDSISQRNYDFALIDVDVFDTSILSIEAAKTVATLVKEGIVKEIVYIDTYFDRLSAQAADNPNSPQKREQDLADNILALDDSLKTLCIMGQWHTRPQPFNLQDGSGLHMSALYRVREVKPDTPFSHNVYRSGQLYNDGRVIDLPVNAQLPHVYKVKQVARHDYELSIPIATRISLPE